MGKKIKEQIQLKQVAWVLLGLVLYALALDLFLAGNNIAAGGLSGIAIVLRTFLPYEIGVMILVMNVPILFIALKMNGWKYTILTLVNTVLYSLAVDMFASFPTLTTDPLVAAVFGGFMYGAGVMALALGRGSTGGTDLICRLIVKKFPHLSLGKVVLMVECCIIAFAMIAFQDIEVGLYALIAIVVSSEVADRLLLGLDKGCICMVVTSGDEEEIAKVLMDSLHRAVTKVDGTGMYKKSSRSILYIAVRPKETVKVKQILSQADPDAFVMVIPANEVLGGTFRLKNSV